MPTTMIPIRFLTLGTTGRLTRLTETAERHVSEYFQNNDPTLWTPSNIYSRGARESLSRQQSAKVAACIPTVLLVTISNTDPQPFINGM